MAIPVDIQELLDARVVESTRIEYKAGFDSAVENYELKHLSCFEKSD